MKRRFASVTLALIAACAVAGCGQDNNDNGGPETPGTATPTVVPPTRTATPGVTETPTDSGPTSTAPTATRTPSDGGMFTLTLLSAAGSDLDAGWTGLSHNQVAIEQVQVSVNLDCTGDDCIIDGSALNGKEFGSPLPLSSNNVAVCVRNVFTEAVTGTYNKGTGDSVSSVRITSFVTQSPVSDKPCPNCNGDPTPNDGVAQGTCDNDAVAAGAPCDVGGISPSFGPTSITCLPKASSIGELDINLSPLTTGALSRPASVTCAGNNQPAGSCYCEGQDRQNACRPNVDACGADGFCTGDPSDTRCSDQAFRVCNADADCAQFGAGTCQTQPRSCFGDSISSSGTPAVPGVPGALTAFFCIPPTRAPAVNTVAGLPGPGVVTLPGVATLTRR